MKAIKLTALAVALVSSSAMANMVTTTTGNLVDGGRTVLTTLAKPVAVTAEVGTLGYGANVAWSVDESTELQAGWSGAKFDKTFKVDDKSLLTDHKNLVGIKADFKAKANMSTPYVGVQLRPFKNWLTVGTGVMVPQHKINAEVVVKQADGNEFEYEGNKYKLNGDAKIAFEAKNKNTLAPYLTVGVRPNLNSRFGLFGEVGAAYVGGYKTNLVLPKSSDITMTEYKGKPVAVNAGAASAVVNAGAATGTVVPPKDPVVQLRQDMEKDLDKAEKLGVWPIIKVGATVRF